MSDPEEPEALSEAEVLAYLAPVAERLLGDLGLDPGRAEVLAAALAGDEGATALLSAAYEEGRRDAARRMLASGGKVAEADWSDVESPGERRLIVREDSACARCVHAGVCAVARATTPEMLVVITRCAGFLDGGA